MKSQKPHIAPNPLPEEPYRWCCTMGNYIGLGDTPKEAFQKMVALYIAVQDRGEVIGLLRKPLPKDRIAWAPGWFH